MTVLNTGSTKQYSANWEDIFSRGKAKKKSANGAKPSATTKSSGKKKAVAKTKIGKKATKSGKTTAKRGK
jgi:hypothetical protein